MIKFQCFLHLSLVHTTNYNALEGCNHGLSYLGLNLGCDIWKCNKCPAKSEISPGTARHRSTPHPHYYLFQTFSMQQFVSICSTSVESKYEVHSKSLQVSRLTSCKSQVDFHSQFFKCTSQLKVSSSSRYRRNNNDKFHTPGKIVLQQPWQGMWGGR